MRISNKFGAFFTSIMFSLFVFSGILKWIPFWPVDPTLLFGVILTAILFKNLATKSLVFSKRVAYAIIFTGMFFVWYLFTASYSISDIFWAHKEAVLLLSPFAFLFPLVCFRSQAHFTYFKLSILLLAFITASVVLFFYSTGTLDFLLSKSGKEIVAIPDYLVMGSLIGLGILFSVKDFKVWTMLYLVIAVSALLTLGSRGPTLFVFLCVLASVFLFRRAHIVSLSYNPSGSVYTSKDILSAELRKASHVLSKSINSDPSKRSDKRRQGWRVLITILAMVAVMAVAFHWEGAELFMTRFSDIFSEREGFEKATRYNEFLVAVKVIIKDPLLGVGLGGYGVAGYGMDEDVYPHNILLEAFAEAGIPGVILLAAALMTAFIMPVYCLRDNNFIIYYLAAIFLLLNYMKSGGFVGTRDLFAFIGIFLAYSNMRPRWPVPIK